MDVTGNHTTWGSVRALAEAHLPAGLRAALERFDSERVVHLSLPYGKPVIEAGRFEWSLLGEQKCWEQDYGVPIPLALVATKTVELYDLITHTSRHTTKKGMPRAPRDVTRSAPLFMTQAGTFFGLFENFSEDIGQPPLRATAGGTTLMILPPIGTSKHLGQFLRGLNIQRRNIVIEREAEDLRTGTYSKMSFGPYLADILQALDCPWRCDVIVFSPQFVAKIRRSPAADAAITKMTLSQMAVNNRRANLINAILQQPADPENGARIDHVQSLQFIAQGTRPGFAPVLGTARDEDVLPASELHRLIFPPDDETGQDERKGLDPEDRFPQLFRPSLPGETAFYFLARPYSGIYLREFEGADERVDRILNALESQDVPNLGKFWQATPQALEQYLAALPGAARAIKLPSANSNLLRWGMIGFTPNQAAGDADPC